MKLIKEEVTDVQYLVEEDKETKQKNYFITGIFMQSEKKNRNGRIYPQGILSREVERYNQNYVNKNRAFGELGHPDTPSLNLERVSHKIVSLVEDGNTFKGKALVLETPYGMIVKNFIDSGVNLGVSSRAMGSVVMTKEGYNLVQDDLRLATAADIVADPSAPGAFVQGIMENKEWLFVEGRFVEVDFDNAKRQIRQAPRNQVESVALKLFENYLSKL